MSTTHPAEKAPENAHATEPSRPTRTSFPGRVSLLARSTRIGEPIPLNLTAPAPMRDRDCAPTLPSIESNPTPTDRPPMRPDTMPDIEEGPTTDRAPSAATLPGVGRMISDAPTTKTLLPPAPSSIAREAPSAEHALVDVDVTFEEPTPTPPSQSARPEPQSARSEPPADRRKRRTSAARSLVVLPLAVAIAAGVATADTAWTSPRGALVARRADRSASVRKVVEPVRSTRPVEPTSHVVTAEPRSPVTSTASPPAPPSATHEEAPFDGARAAKAVHSAASNAASRCAHDGPPASARVMVTFAPSGRVVEARVDGPVASETKRCVLRALYVASVPPFAGPARNVVRHVAFR